MGRTRFFPLLFQSCCSQSLSFFDRWSRETKTLGARLKTVGIMFHARIICRSSMLSRGWQLFENLNNADIISMRMFEACDVKIECNNLSLKNRLSAFVFRRRVAKVVLWEFLMEAKTSTLLSDSYKYKSRITLWCLVPRQAANLVPSMPIFETSIVTQKAFSTLQAY